MILFLFILQSSFIAQIQPIVFFSPQFRICITFATGPYFEMEPLRCLEENDHNECDLLQVNAKGGISFTKKWTTFQRRTCFVRIFCHPGNRNPSDLRVAEAQQESAVGFGHEHVLSLLLVHEAQYSSERKRIQKEGNFFCASCTVRAGPRVAMGKKKSQEGIKGSQQRPIRGVWSSCEIRKRG